VTGDVTGDVTGKADEADGLVETGSGGATLKKKVVEIGDWNMDSTYTAAVAHGLGANFSKIRHVEVMIRNDEGTGLYKLQYIVATGAGKVTGGFLNATDSTNINIEIFSGQYGFFDSTDFNATSYNRGWITIEYEA